MNLKQLINKTVYGTIGYITSQDDLDTLESYILYNLPVLKEFKQIVVATNYGISDWHDLQKQRKKNFELWRKYFPECVLIDSRINRGHNFGTADLDNMVFDWCKENNEGWLCKSANDVILQDIILDKEVNEADFYYLDGISYETLYLNNFNSEKLLGNYFYPQTNFYFINVSKTDYLNEKQYLDETYEYSKTILNYNGKIWEYIEGWSCENFLKNCIKRNRLSKEYLLNLPQHKKLCEAIQMYQVGDPSHKNIMIEGICHFQFPNQNIIEI
jgi:hypothetical protein